MVRVLRPLPAESLKLLVFDLDGTLIDSARDLCNSVNATLVEFEREPPGSSTTIVNTNSTTPMPTKEWSKHWQLCARFPMDPRAACPC